MSLSGERGRLAFSRFVQQSLIYVQRLVFDRVFGIPPEGRLKNICGHTLYINPHHWLLGAQEVPEPPEFSEDYPLEEAIGVVDMYLDLHTSIDRNHNLLVDMPEEFLRGALVELNKEHLI